MSKAIVIIEKNQVKTNSLVVSEWSEVKHKNVVELIREHQTDIEYFGIIARTARKSRRGKPTIYYDLNEEQAMYLMTLMANTEPVKRFKKSLVSEFTRMRKAIMQIEVNHQNKEWQQARLDGKAIRKETTDAIKDFVEYAIKQGSKSASTYYMNISKMENKALFILEQKFDNIRNVLNNHQLSTLKTADRIVYESLQEGMERNMNYKDIYQMAKERVETLAKLVKPTIVISMTEVKLLE